MKKKVIISVFSVMSFILFSALTYAQGPSKGDNPGSDNRNIQRPAFDLVHQIPDLSDAQVKQIDELHVELMQETTPLRKQLMVKRAELEVLSTGESVDLNQINKKVDEISGLEGELMKKHEALRQDIRGLLNEKQRVFFDSRPPRFEKGRDNNNHGDERMMHQPHRAPGDCPLRKF